MKTLIFSLSTGRGHDKAAENLRNLYFAAGYEAKIIDGMHVVSPFLDKMVVSGYSAMANTTPSLYGKAYNITDRSQSQKIISPLLSKISKNKISVLIRKENPDLLVSTHPFMVPVIGQLKKENRVDLPFISIVTDYKAHELYIHNQVDAYIVGSPYTKVAMIQRGISGNKIYPSGIPISQEYYQKSGRNKKEVFQLIVMAGSIGYDYITKAVRELLKIEKPIHIVALCGDHAKIIETMENHFSKEIAKNKLSVLGFVDNMADLMEESHCVLSKPGGLTTTESIHKNLPMILPYCVPGQEQDNLNFLVRNNMAISASTPESIRNTVEDFIDHPEKLQAMAQNMKKLSDSLNPEKIIEISNELKKPSL